MTHHIHKPLPLETAEIDDMIDSGLKEVDLMEIALEDCLGRRELRRFLRAALSVRRMNRSRTADRSTPADYIPIGGAGNGA